MKFEDGMEKPSAPPGKAGRRLVKTLRPAIGGQKYSQNVQSLVRTVDCI